LSYPPARMTAARHEWGLHRPPGHGVRRDRPFGDAARAHLPREPFRNTYRAPDESPGL